MGLGLSRNLSGGPFSFRLSGNTWLFWVVCSCKKRKYERQGWGLGLLWGQGCHQDGSGQGKGGGTKKQRHAERERRPSGVPLCPAGPLPLTTTWLQRTSESFIHTASKLSSRPKLHSREVPYRHRAEA